MEDGWRWMDARREDSRGLAQVRREFDDDVAATAPAPRLRPHPALRRADMSSSLVGLVEPAVRRRGAAVPHSEDSWRSAGGRCETRLSEPGPDKYGDHRLIFTSSAQPQDCKSH